MKRISTFIVSSVIAGVVFTSTAFAGINYADYRTEVEATKGASSTSESRQVQTGNKYVRMVEERSSVSTSTESGSNRTQVHNKYLELRR